MNYTLFFENAENSEEPVYIQDIQKNASSALINGIKEGTGSLNIGEEDVEFNDGKFFSNNILCRKNVDKIKHVKF